MFIESSVRQIYEWTVHLEKMALSERDQRKLGVEGSLLSDK